MPYSARPPLSAALRGARIKDFPQAAQEAHHRVQLAARLGCLRPSTSATQARRTAPTCAGYIEAVGVFSFAQFRLGREEVAAADHG